jgi:replication factor C subunit 1
MFTTIYRPKKISQFIGNANIINSLIKWLFEWDSSNAKAKCALISGINGIGKSLLVELVLHKFNYNLINLSIDENRDKETMNQSIKPLLGSKKTFDGQVNCLVISDIDCGGGCDYGFIATLSECIKETQIPIICICDDRYNQNIKPIIHFCLDFKLMKPPFEDIYNKLIHKIVTAENINISKNCVENLYNQSNGDIRFILNSLQLGCNNRDTGKNIQSLNIFDTAGKLLSLDTSEEDKFNYYWMAHDMHTLMVHENYINNTLLTRDEMKRSDNLAYSADALSDADLFDSVFNFELSTHVAMNTIKSTAKCNKKTMIKFPQYLGKISIMNKNKREKINYENVIFGEKKTIVKEKVVKEKVVKEKVVKEKVVKEKVVKEKVVKEKVVKEKVVKEKVIKEKVKVMKEI